MVFIRKINGYYVLVRSVRKGKKVVKESRYIGKTLPPKARLERLKEEFIRETEEGRYRYFSAEEAARIAEIKERNAKELKSLSPLEKSRRLGQFMIRFTYDSSKLSGVNVTLRQTSLILKDGIVPKGFRSLRTVKEVENHEKGVVAITKFRGRLGMGFLKKLHKILFAGVDDAITGKFRSGLKRDVKIAGTPYVPPKWNVLDKEIAEFFKWYGANSRRLHPLELAALTHLKINSIQPFTDGNSRVSRLLMNWILWKKGYPMIDIKIEDIENYYNALDKYQIERKERPFVRYVMEKYFEGD
ncbi:MAG: Fic family protein [Candidatus Diapherotrites archaeon]